MTAASPPNRPIDSDDEALRERTLVHARERAIALEAADAQGAPPAPDPDPEFLRGTIMHAPDLHALYCREYERHFHALKALRGATPTIGLCPAFRLRIDDLLTLIAHVYGLPKTELVQRGFNRYRGHLVRIYAVVCIVSKTPFTAAAFREEPEGPFLSEQDRFRCIPMAMNDLCARGYLPKGEIALILDS